MANEFLIKLLLDHGDALAETDKLITQIEKLDKAQKEFGKTGSGFDNMSTDIKAAEASSDKLSSSIDETLKSIDKTEKSSKKAGDSLKGMGKEAAGAGKGLDKVQENLDKTSKNTDKAGKSLKNYGDGFKSIFAKIFPLYGQLDDSLGGIVERNDQLATSSNGTKKAFSVVTSGIASATRAGLAFIATPIGAAIAALAAIGTIASKFVQFNQAVLKTNATIEGITGTTGEMVDSIRIRSESLLNVFDVSIEETTKTAQKLVATFGITYAEAFDQLEEGLIRGAKANDQFFDSLQEYGVFFKDAGFSVDEFRKVVEAGYDLGVYNDKLPDAIKEFNLSIKEQTTASRDALVGAFGEKFTNKLFANINSGAITSKDALAAIAAEADKVGLNSKQAATITADVFRGAGEDVGGALKVFEAINLALSDQVVDYTELELVQKRRVELDKELLQAQDDAFKSNSFLEFQANIQNGWVRIKIFTLEVFTAMRESIQGTFAVFTTIGDTIRTITKPITDLVSRFKEFEFVQNLFNKAGDEGTGVMARLKEIAIAMFNPFSLIANTIKVLGAAFNGTLNAAKEFYSIMYETVTAFGDFDWSSPIDSLRNLDFSGVKNIGSDVGNAFIDGYKEVMDVEIDTTLSENIDKTKEKVDELDGTFKKLGDAAKKPIIDIKSLDKQIVDLKKTMSDQIFEGNFLGSIDTQEQILKIEQLIATIKTAQEIIAGKQFEEGTLPTLNTVQKFTVDDTSLDEFIPKFNEFKSASEETIFVPVEVDVKEELFNKAKEAIAGLFKVDQKVVDELFDGLGEIAPYALDIAYQMYDLRLQTLDNEIEAIQKRKAAITDGLDQEYDAQQSGLANSYDLRKESLAAIEAEEERAIKARAELQNKAAKAEFIAETASQVLNMLTAATKIYNSLAAIPIIGVAGATAIVGGMFAAYAGIKARAFSQIGNLAEGGSMEDYFTSNQRESGNYRTYGLIDHKGGKSDKNQQKGMRVGNSNLYVNGNERVMRNELNHSQGAFLDDLNKNWQKYEGIDFSNILANQLDPSSYNVNFQSYKDVVVEMETRSVTYDQMVQIMNDHARKVEPNKDPAPYQDKGQTVIQKGSNRKILV